MNRPPAHTSVSLLASATIAPRSAAASVGLRPAAPVIAPITHSAGRSAASIKPLSPAAASIPVPASAPLRSPKAAGSATAAKRAPSSRASAASAAALLLAHTASTRKRLRSRLSRSTVLAPTEPVAPSSVTVRSAVDDRFHVARDGSDFIDSPHQQTATRRVEAPARQSDQYGGQAGGHDAVEAVHKPAVSGNEATRILGAEPTLEDRLEQVPALRAD